MFEPYKSYFDYEEMRKQKIMPVDIIQSMASGRKYYLFDNPIDNYIRTHKYVSNSRITQRYSFILKVQDLDGKKVKTIHWKPRWWQKFGLLMAFKINTRDMEVLSEADLLDILDKINLAEGYYAVLINKFHTNTEIEIYDVRRAVTLPMMPVMTQGHLEVFALDPSEFQPLPSTKKYTSTAYRLFNHIIVPTWWDREAVREVPVYEFRSDYYVSKSLLIDTSGLSSIKVYSEDHERIILNVDEIKEKYNFGNLMLVFAHSEVQNTD